jgi:hypothetical protein
MCHQRLDGCLNPGLCFLAYACGAKERPDAKILLDPFKKKQLDSSAQRIECRDRECWGLSLQGIGLSFAYVIVLKDFILSIRVK